MGMIDVIARQHGLNDNEREEFKTRATEACIRRGYDDSLAGMYMMSRFDGLEDELDKIAGSVILTYNL